LYSERRSEAHINAKRKGGNMEVQKPSGERSRVLAKKIFIGGGKETEKKKKK